MLLTVSWFGIIALYTLIRKPTMYDGIRHFLFILPPLFILTGFGFAQIINLTSRTRFAVGTNLLMAVVLIAPGASAIVHLHPYEYAYYNSYVGGTSGAFRSFETDYWLTCYKEAVEQLENSVAKPVNLFVKREAYIANYYAGSLVHVEALRGARNDVFSGDYILVNTRTNEDLSTFRDAVPFIKVKRGNAVFCIVKVMP